MIEHIGNLVRQGAWAELHHLAETLPPGDVKARAYLKLSAYVEATATDGHGYRMAVAHARQALLAAEADGPIHAWACARIAALCADLGMYQDAEHAATRFLLALPAHTAVQVMEPWGRFALARALASRRQFVEAIAEMKAALKTAEGEIAERIRLHLVWTLAQSGLIHEALRELPEAVNHVSVGHLSAAKTMVCATVGDWAGARESALAALSTRQEWELFDRIQVAELYLILRQAALRSGEYVQSAVWFAHTAATLSGWNAGLILTLLPTLPQKGGRKRAAARSSCGSAGDHRCGLRGVVG